MLSKTFVLQECFSLYILTHSYLGVEENTEYGLAATAIDILP